MDVKTSKAGGAGNAGVTRELEDAVGAVNLKKAATAREGRHSRSGQTLQERPSPREKVMG